MPDTGDERRVGYIRSDVVSNALCLFPPGNIQRLEASRRTRIGKEKDDIDVDWFDSQLLVTRDADVEYDRARHGSPFPIESLDEAISKLDLGEMTIEEIEFRFEDPECVKAINTHYMGKDGAPEFDYDEDTELFVTFENQSLDDIIGSMKWTRILNDEITERYNISRIGVLNLTEFSTLEGKTSFTDKMSENIQPHRVPDLIRNALQNLNQDKWDTEVRDPDTGEIAEPNPAVQRIEQWGEQGDWVVEDEEA